jgi:hypothetical protein
VNAERVRLRDRLDQVELDLGDLDDQVDAGELDVVTADRLRATYVAERDEITRALDSIEAGAETVPSRRSRPRMMAGAAILAIGAVVVIVAAVVSLQDRDPGGSATGGIVDDVVEQGGVDLSTVTNEELEAVIAQNPDVVGMRLALARRYFDASDFSNALDHYMVVLEAGEHPEALANVGWMTHLSGRSDLAETFVARALVLAPKSPQVHWFMGVILYEGLGDACGAIAHFELVLSFDDLPGDVRAAAARMVGAAREAC